MQIDEHSLQFESFRKIARLNRDVIVTEKIDGTNGQILIRRIVDVNLVELNAHHEPESAIYVERNGEGYVMFAGSRHRWLSAENDNAGFFRWVEANAADLVKLGPGRHFGEWWGSGIQRGYGLTGGDKRFSLFNVQRWVAPTDGDVRPDCCRVVPLLHRGDLDTEMIGAVLRQLERGGSYAMPGYARPEGLVVLHTHANQLFKVLSENDDVSKTEAIARAAKPARAVAEPASSEKVVQIVNQLVADHPEKAEQARSNSKLLGWFVGNVMKQTGGGAHPQATLAVVQEKLRRAA